MVEYIYTLSDDDAVTLESTTAFEKAAADSPLDVADISKSEDCIGPYINLKMLSSAGLYEVDGLKQVARKKMKTAILDASKLADYPCLIRLVYRDTRSTDMGLRKFTTRDAAKRIPALRKRDDFQSLVLTTSETKLCLTGRTFRRENRGSVLSGLVFPMHVPPSISLYGEARVARGRKNGRTSSSPEDKEGAPDRADRRRTHTQSSTDILRNQSSSSTSSEHPLFEASSIAYRLIY